MRSRLIREGLRPCDFLLLRSIGDRPNQPDGVLSRPRGWCACWWCRRSSLHVPTLTMAPRAADGVSKAHLAVAEAICGFLTAGVAAWQGAVLAGCVHNQAGNDSVPSDRRELLEAPPARGTCSFPRRVPNAERKLPRDVALEKVLAVLGTVVLVDLLVDDGAERKAAAAAGGGRCWRGLVKAHRNAACFPRFHHW